ncbi:MAG TPA: PEP-CTERM sorting domain-containing protein [Tepidisphaeraceae bacterium]|jgi:hypothetical protein
MTNRAFVIVMAGVLLCAAPAFSVPTFYVVQNDNRFDQTGPSTVAASGFGFVGSATPNDGIGPIGFDGGSISFPASSPLTPTVLTASGPNLRFRSPVLDQATFQADFPIGTYTFNLTDSGNPSHTEQESVDDSIATAPSTVPTLTATSFNALQGADPTHDITVNFHPFADSTAASLIFFGVADSSNNTLFLHGLQPNVTQDTIPANALQAGQQYAAVLFFTNIVITPDNVAEVIMDNRTQATFTTQPVPEPSTAVSISLLSALGIGSLRQRQRRRRTWRS